jgi:hypothetical protein
MSSSRTFPAKRLNHGGVLRRSQGYRQNVFIAGSVDADRRHQHTVTNTQPVDLDHQQVEPRQVSRQPFLQLCRAQRHKRETEDFVAARLAWPARSPSGSVSSARPYALPRQSASG